MLLMLLTCADNLVMNTSTFAARRTGKPPVFETHCWQLRELGLAETDACWTGVFVCLLVNN